MVVSYDHPSSGINCGMFSCNYMYVYLVLYDFSVLLKSSLYFSGVTVVVVKFPCHATVM